MFLFEESAFPEGVRSSQTTGSFLPLSYLETWINTPFDSYMLTLAVSERLNG